MPLHQLSPEEQYREIEKLRNEGIWKHNLKIIKEGGKNFMRERSQNSLNVPVMCAGCKKFIAKTPGCVPARRIKSISTSCGN